MRRGFAAWAVVGGVMSLSLAGCQPHAQSPGAPGRAAQTAQQPPAAAPTRGTAPPAATAQTGALSPTSPPATTPQSAAPSSTPSRAFTTTPAAPGPLGGPLENEKSYAVGASGQNTNIRLTVTDLRVATDAGGTTAPQGRQYVILTAAWKNLVPPKTVQRPKSGGRTGIVGGGEMETVVVETPYMVRTLSENLYLLLDGRYVAEVSGASNQLPDHLSLTGLLVQHYNDEVKGTVAFEVPAGPLQSLTLQFFDFTHGHITLPLYGTAPSIQDRPIAGPARNQFFDAVVYRTEYARKVGQSEAPAGRQYLTVDFGAASVAPGAAAQLDFDQYASLIEDGVYQIQPVKELTGVPYHFHGLTRFIPGYVRRGMLVFLVPEQPGRLELLLAASQMSPLRFLLTPGVQAKGLPQPVRVIKDGDVAEIRINGVTSADRLGDVAAPQGHRYLILDITVADTAPSQGLTVEPRQFALTDGQATFEASGATGALPHPLAGERAVSAGTQSRFEVAFDVPQDARTLRLKYQGYTKIEEVPLP